jgi:hypothetical protein
MSITGNTQYWGISGQTNVNPRLITDSILTYVDAANSNSFISGSTTWFDLSKNFSNGTRFGTLSSTTENLGAMYFNGSTNYVNFTKMNKTVLGSTFTISLWLKTSSSVTSTKAALQFGNSIFNGFQLMFFRLTVNSSTSQSFYYVDGSIRHTGTFIGDVWNQLTVSCNNGVWSFYFNGTLEGVYVGNVGSNVGTTCILGSGYTGGNGFLLGYISNFIIYSRELSLDEVRNNYLALKDRYGLIQNGPT